MPRLPVLLALLLAAHATSALAQDSIPTLPPIGVTLARTTAPAAAIGLPVSTVSGAVARRGRPFAGLDELMAFLPGVLATDRGDATVDQRLAVRGAGGRANFGIRGIRVLVDGFPATLPDGQTQLGPLIPLAIDQVAVARGPLAALHGNGATGVLALETVAAPRAGSRLTTALQAGTAAVRQATLGLAVGTGRLGATLFATREAGDGMRDHAAFTQRRLLGGLTWQPGAGDRLLLRVGLQDDPFSASPGALTLAEFAVDPGGAAPRNLALDAGKSVRQRQVGIGWDHTGSRVSLVTRGWLLDRDLENPIAAPAPGEPSRGTWIGLDRRVHGLSSTLTWRARPVLDLTAGVDAQRMRDDRTNRPHDGDGPAGAAVLDQVEVVDELGAFVQATWRVHRSLGIRAGLRRDDVRFAVTDRLVPDAGGRRTLAATSGSVSLGWHDGPTEAWLGAGQSFETPTTTELSNRPDGSTGLNRNLLPARTRSVELGVRHGTGRIRVEGAIWYARTLDAILPAADIGGRSLFRNVDRTTSRGVELSGDLLVARGVLVRAAATVLNARFGPGVRDAGETPIGGHRLPGIPPATVRLGLTARRGAWTVDVDHGLRGATEASDDGRLRADGWGPGVTNAALRYAATRGLSVYAVARNLTDRAVAGAVVVNAAGDRFIQPLPGRQVGVGIEMTIE